MTDTTALLVPIRRLYKRIRDAVVAACERSALQDLAEVVQDTEGDTVFFRGTRRIGCELLNFVSIQNSLRFNHLLSKLAGQAPTPGPLAAWEPPLLNLRIKT